MDLLIGTTVSLEQMLAARERRAARQAAALARFDKPLALVTLVMPGPVKDGWLSRRALAPKWPASASVWSSGSSTAPERRIRPANAFSNTIESSAPGAKRPPASIVRMVALPVYDRLRRDGIAEDVALLQVLLHLLAVNSDTNLVSRGGLAGLHYVRAYGLKQMEAFDDALIARHLSPGGTADLLAVTWFLGSSPESHHELMEMVHPSVLN